MEKQKNISQLRFPEFDSGWEKKYLKDVISNKSIKYNPEISNEALKCIELEHLATGTGQLLGYSDSRESGSIKNRFRKGDVLFGKLRPYLRKYLLAPFDGVCSSEIWVINGKTASNEYIYRVIQTEKFIGLANQSSGSKMPRADWDVIASSIFRFPSLPEQQKIASFFTAIDQKISQLKQKLTLLEQYKKGVMQKIFSQEIRFKDENGQEFPKWEKKKLGDIGEIITGKTPSTKDSSRWNGEIQFVTPTDINDNKYQLATERTLQKHHNLKVLPSNSIMFTCIASIGKMSLSVKPCVTNQQINSIIPDTYYENEFVYYALLNIREYIKSTQSANTLPIINKTEFSKFIIQVPIVSEQSKIANFLSAIDDKINHTQKQIEKAEVWKKGLMQQMFV